MSFAVFGELSNGGWRVEAEKTLAAHMQSIQCLLAKAAEAEQLKARRKLDATKEAFETRLRERDAELERAKGDYAKLCTLLKEVDGELRAAYESAAEFMAQRDATVLERDRLAAEAARLGAENARLAAELSNRKSRSGNAGAPRNGTATDTASAGQIALHGGVSAPEAGECPDGPTAGVTAAEVLQNTMFVLTVDADGDGRGSEKVKSKFIEDSVSGQPDAQIAQARAPADSAGDSGCKTEPPLRAGSTTLHAVDAVSRGLAGALGAGGAGG